MSRPSKERPEWRVTDLDGAWAVELNLRDERTDHGCLFEADYFDREAAEMVCNALNSWERAKEARQRFERETCPRCGERLAFLGYCVQCAAGWTAPTQRDAP